MPVEFKTRETLGAGWSLEVIAGGSIQGHIRKLPSGSYVYFRGLSNMMNHSIEDKDLERLKELVRGNP